MEDMAITRDGIVWLALTGFGYLVIGKDGRVEKITPADQLHSTLLLAQVEEVDGCAFSTVFAGLRPAHIVAINTLDQGVSAIAGPALSSSRAVYSTRWAARQWLLWPSGWRRVPNNTALA